MMTLRSMETENEEGQTGTTKSLKRKRQCRDGIDDKTKDKEGKDEEGEEESEDEMSKAAGAGRPLRGPLLHMNA